MKHRDDGTFERFRIRLEVKGYTQQKGIDYTDCYDEHCQNLTSHCNKDGMECVSIRYVNNVFWHGDLHKELFIEVPPGLVTNTLGLVFKLHKSLYGLKQANRQWYAKHTKTLYSRGYTYSMHGYSFFYKKNHESIIIVIVYVDDIILTRTDLSEIQELKMFLHDTFKIKNLGKFHYFIGLKGIIISQRKFLLDLLKEYNVVEHSSFTSPLDLTIKLHAKEGSVFQDPTFYRKLIGKINFLTNTKMYITYEVPHLIPFMKNPREPHLAVAFYLLRSLKSDTSSGLFLSQYKNIEVQHIVIQTGHPAQTLESL